VINYSLYINVGNKNYLAVLANYIFKLVPFHVQVFTTMEDALEEAQVKIHG